MEPVRKPFQGIYNIIRFNWHFSVLSFVFLLALCIINRFLIAPYLYVSYIIMFGSAAVIIISLSVSYYVYDRSGFYQLDWLDELQLSPTGTMININAGFDEMSAMLKYKYPEASLIVYDFYDPLKHTEISIKRARKAYPPFPGTRHIDPSSIPLENNCANNIFMILSAHEIRTANARTDFFQELSRILKPGGKIVMVEHLRDTFNLLAYNIGFFHFIPKSLWEKAFEKAGLTVSTEKKLTPFITCFALEKNGIEP
jgi:ubiquinone/menaquinone biosynthesis C-methylase UbiE